MSIGFEAVFSWTKKPLPEILSAVQGVLRDSKVDFSEEVPSSADAGMSLHGVSQSLWETLGPSDGAEVDVDIVKAGQGFYLRYLEHRTAFQQRLKDERLAEELYRLLLRLCHDVEVDVCIYDEESTTGFEAPTVEKVQIILENGKFPSGGQEGVIVLSERLMSFRQAQTLCRNPSRVSLSMGWLLFKLL